MKIYQWITMLSLSSFLGFGQGFSPLYSGEIPNYLPGENLQKSDVSAGILRISNVSEPSYRFYKSPKAGASAPCVVICPGGGYRILAASHEGSDVAEKFNAQGIHALVLYYRLPDDKRQSDKKIAPLQDAQQAIRLVRSQALNWGVDPHKVGIMGFSAGGHLAATTSTHWQKDYTGKNDGISLRPDFQILLYPVISFRDFGHGGSKVALLGAALNEENLHLYSNEEQVNAETPMAFLVHAADDKAVPLQNSLAYAQALTNNQVPVDLHVYAKGGHGFGLNNKTTGDDWFARLMQWMQDRQLR